MKTSLLPILIFVLITVGCAKKEAEPSACGITAETGSASRSLSILFIGTSHTYYHEMPKLLDSIATSFGDQVYTEMSAPGSYDFERHYTLQATKTALQSRQWDYIVLQESGWRTALPPSEAARQVYPYADSLHKLIRVSNANAKLVLYMTHGYLGGVNAFGEAAWCNADPTVCTYEGMQERIKGTYLRLADQLKATVVPCGVLWRILKDKNSALVLHDADNMHPSLLGSYANALALYSVIRQKPLKGVFKPSAMDAQQASFVQNTVSEALFECQPDWKSF